MLRTWLRLQKPIVQPFLTEKGEMYWELDTNKRVTVNEFKNNLYIHIRQYDQIEGKDYFVPTKKGIALNVEQFEKLKEIIDSVDVAVKEKQNPGESQ